MHGCFEEVAMIYNNICPFCKESTALVKSKRTGYSVYGSGKYAIKQFFHNSCFDEYIVNRKKKNWKVGEGEK
jgi:hypothetical protein